MADPIDFDAADDATLLWLALRYLEGIRAHPALCLAVRRAAKRERGEARKAGQKVQGEGT